MKSNKRKLGTYITKATNRNSDLKYGFDDVRGVSNSKQIQKTKADISERSFNKFQIVSHHEFVFNRRTTRMGDKIGLGFNDTESPFIVTEDYVVFKVIDTALLLPEYLFIFFNRPEFDRYARWDSWGSATEFFNWEEMCDVDIEVPTLEVQQKYVDIYKTMRVNQSSYEKGLDDLKLTCDAYIEKLLSESPLCKIRHSIFLLQQKNSDFGLTKESVRGISNQKEFIPTKANLDGVSLRPYLIVPPEFFSYVSVTSRNGEKISIAYNNTEHTYLVSSSYICFGVNKEVLNPDYLAMFFNKDEFNRYARFHSWGSAREVFSWDDLCEVKIPIPDIDIQEAIVNIYKVYNKRKEINESLKHKMKDICPILIKGALQEQG